MKTKVNTNNKINKSLLMKWAWKLYRKERGNSDKHFAECLSKAWKLIKTYTANDDFARLYNKYYAGLYNYIALKVSEMDAEELTNDAFIKINENYILYDVKIGNEGSWLYGIAKNSVIDFYRKNDKYNANTSISDYTDDNGKEIFQIADNAETDQNVERGELMSAIYKAMDKSLNQTQRKVAELHLIKEYTYEEVCNELNLSMNNVKSIIRRMKIALQIELMKERAMYY